MGHYYSKGIEVPKSKAKSLEYDIMLAEHPEDELEFMKQDIDYGWLLAGIGVKSFALGNLDIAETYTARAKDYFLKKYAPEKAEETMTELRIDARLAVIKEMREAHKPTV